jgi:hypothetical protein
MRSVNSIVAVSICTVLLPPMQQAWSAQAASTTSAPSDAAELSPPVNPAKCKTGDKAYVYWAAKDQVFRFKYDPALPIHPYPESLLTRGMHFDARQEIPPAPDPSEPLGCYGNPLRALQIPYMAAFDAELFQKLAGRKLDRLTAGPRGFYALPTNFYANGDDGKLFRGSKDCWQRSSGVHECLLANPMGKDRTDYSISHAFRIDKNLLPKHPQVSDIYFVVWNDAASGVRSGQNGKVVDSRIYLFGNVFLESSFRIFPQEIDLLIPYYSGLIRYVLDAHVPDYKWTATKTK